MRQIEIKTKDTHYIIGTDEYIEVLTNCKTHQHIILWLN